MCLRCDDMKIHIAERQQHKHVKSRDPRWKHDKYTCICGFESTSTSEFNRHIGLKGTE